MNDQRVSYRSTFPTRIIATCTTIAILLLLLLLLINTLDPQARAAREAATWRQAQIDQALTPIDLFVAAGWRLLPLALVAGAGLVGLIILYRRFALQQFIVADKEIALTRARVQQFPSNLHSLNIRDRARPQIIEQQAILPEPEQEQQPAIKLPQPAPGETLLHAYQRAGIINRSGDSLHIGHIVTSGTPVYLELEQWGGLALGGLSRTGKTSRAVYVACQGALAGWRMALCDMDGPDENGRGGKKDALTRKLQPLVSAGLISTVATAPESIATCIINTYEILERRRAGDACYHYLLIIDEFTNLVVASWLPDEVLDMLVVLANRGAGYGIHCLMIGHDWASAASGNSKRGALLRRIMTQQCAHRLSADGARILAPGRRDAQQRIVSLPDYQAVYLDRDGWCIVDSPYMTADDIEYAAHALSADRSRRATQTHSLTEDNDSLLSNLFSRNEGNEIAEPVTIEGNKGNNVVTASEQGNPRSLPVTLTPAEAAKIATLLTTLPPSDVAKKLDGYTPKKYAEFKAKVEQVQAMLKG
jgi:hypothetical protein